MEMMEGFEDHLPGRIWWVNKNTKTITSLRDHSVAFQGEIPKPPGLEVFAPLVSPFEMDKIVHEINEMYSEEHKSQTFPRGVYRNMNILFDHNDSEVKPMTFSEVLGILDQRTPVTASAMKDFAESARLLLGISKDTLLEKGFITIAYYPPNAGLNSHIDNVGKTHGTMGPVFTMSVGRMNTSKHMDMFPVIEHELWPPVRVSAPTGSIMLLDGVARTEWSHAIPKDDPTNRITLMLKFEQITDNKVGYSKKLDTDIHASVLHLEETYDAHEREEGDGTWHKTFASISRMNQILV